MDNNNKYVLPSTILIPKHHLNFQPHHVGFLTLRVGIAVLMYVAFLTSALYRLLNVFHCYMFILHYLLHIIMLLNNMQG